MPLNLFGNFEMQEQHDLKVTFHGATAEFIELLKRQAADPVGLTKDELQMIAHVVLKALENTKPVLERHR